MILVLKYTTHTENEYMKGTDNFKRTVQDYLDERAETIEVDLNAMSWYNLVVSAIKTPNITIGL